MHKLNQNDEQPVVAELALLETEATSTVVAELLTTVSFFQVLFLIQRKINFESTINILTLDPKLSSNF